VSITCFGFYDFSQFRNGTLYRHHLGLFAIGVTTLDAPVFVYPTQSINWF
jgi:hypothetical protein